MSAAVEQITAAIKAVEAEVNEQHLKTKEYQKKAADLVREIATKESALSAVAARLDRETAAANEKLNRLAAEVATFEEQRAVAVGNLKATLATLQRAEADLAAIRARLS